MESYHQGNLKGLAILFYLLLLYGQVNEKYEAIAGKIVSHRQSCPLHVVTVPKG
jgi:hypothetical protein